jgi:hypothetical protein
VRDIFFDIEILARVEDTPTGFLFLCPAKEFQTTASSFRWPDCPAYWSFDPSGVERLSMDDATALGFPSLELNTTVWGRFWDASVYAGLSQFHQAKGFNSESQDVAQHLGHPLYQLSSESDAPFAHSQLPIPQLVPFDSHQFIQVENEDYYSEDDRHPFNVNESEDLRSSASEDGSYNALTDLIWLMILISDEVKARDEDVPGPIPHGKSTPIRYISPAHINIISG